MIYLPLPSGHRMPLRQTLVEGMRQAGSYSINWDGRDDAERELASGVYLYRLQVGGGKQVETVLVLFDSRVPTLSDTAFIETNSDVLRHLYPPIRIQD